jgi:hypothetical protein
MRLRRPGQTSRYGRILRAAGRRARKYVHRNNLRLQQVGGQTRAAVAVKYASAEESAGSGIAISMPNSTALRHPGVGQVHGMGEKWVEQQVVQTGILPLGVFNIV